MSRRPSDQTLVVSAFGVVPAIGAETWGTHRDDPTRPDSRHVYCSPNTEKLSH